MKGLIVINIRRKDIWVETIKIVMLTKTSWFAFFLSLKHCRLYLKCVTSSPLLSNMLESQLMVTRYLRISLLPGHQKHCFDCACTFTPRALVWMKCGERVFSSKFKFNSSMLIHWSQDSWPIRSFIVLFAAQVNCWYLTHQVDIKTVRHESQIKKLVAANCQTRSNSSHT